MKLLFTFLLSLATMIGISQTLITGSVVYEQVEPTDLYYPNLLGGKNYYVDSKNGNDANNGLTPITAWQTTTKVNAFASYTSNDSILFKRNRSFYGGVRAKRANITFGAYGLGQKPIITGFTTVDNWIDVGGGIYKKNIPTLGNKLSVVTVDEQWGLIARTPNIDASNQGWRLITTVNAGAKTFTSAPLATDPSWSGGKVVTKKKRWIIDVCPIVSHTGNTINYGEPTETITGQNPFVAGWGYFIMDHINALDQFREYYLDKTTKDLYVYFGSEDPKNHTVRVSTVDTLFNFGGNGYPENNNVTITDIKLVGANRTGTYGRYMTNSFVKNCDIEWVYNGITYPTAINAQALNNNISHILNNGIAMTTGNPAYIPFTIVGNTIFDVGNVPGMSGSGDQVAIAIRQEGNNATITDNILKNVGYIGIEFHGSNTLVARNKIDTFCVWRDDGGAIYTQGDSTATNRVIRDNFAYNGIGCVFGTLGGDGTPSENHSARGLYSDNKSSGEWFYNNTVINTVGPGMYMNNTIDTKVEGNIFFNTQRGIYTRRLFQTPLQRRDTFINNVMYPYEINIYYDNNGLAQLPDPPGSIQADMRLAFAPIDGNYYRSLTNQFGYQYWNNFNFSNGFGPFYLNLAGWKTYINGEATSKLLPTSTPRIYDNYSKFPMKVDLAGVTLKDKDGNNVTGIVTVPAYSSVMLFE